MTTSPHKLSSQDVQRLLNIAPLFDVHPLTPTDGERITLEIRDPRGGAPSVLTLPREIAICRVLAEVGSRTVRWVYFHAGEPASISLLRNSDARLTRIGELYARWKAQGCPA